MLSLKSLFRRLVGLVLLIFQLPAFACAIKSTLIWMTPPVGIYALLVSPWSPFFWFKETSWLTTYNLIIPYMNFLGLVLMVLGTGIFILSCVQLFRQWKKGLVTYGLYSVVRHPQYFGWILAHIGISILFSVSYSMLFTPILLALIYLISKKEEEELIKEFDNEYEDYKKNVPMLMS